MYEYHEINHELYESCFWDCVGTMNQSMETILKSMKSYCGTPRSQIGMKRDTKIYSSCTKRNDF